MATPAATPPGGRASGALDPLLRFVAAVLVLACIYWAQAVLIPVALAVLITFLLTPPVLRLQRWRVPRALSVITVFVLALALVGGIGTVLALQVMSLGEELPRYRDNIREKIADVRLLGRGTGLQRAKETVTRADDVEALRTALGAAGAEGVATSLLETRDLVVHLARSSERAA